MKKRDDNISSESEEGSEEEEEGEEEEEDDDAEENEEGEGSRSEGSEDEEDEEEEKKKQKEKEREKKKKKKRKRPDIRGDKGKKRHAKKKRKRRKPISSFLDIEAQVGDDDEDEEDDDMAAYGDEAREAEMARAQIEMEHRRKQQALKRAEEERWEEGRRGGAAHLENAIDKIARRYQDQTYNEEEDFDEDEDYLDDTEPIDYDQQGEPGALLPDISDPKLWMVKVSRGGVADIERTLAIAIEKKFFSTGGKASDFGIQSVYAADHLKGYIYVEAESQFKIKEALKGLRHVNLAGELKMVPIKEMPAVFNVSTKDKYIPRRGDFVRVKRGIYGGDLAQIYEVDDQEVYVTLRLVPRVDINAILEKEHGGASGMGGGGQGGSSGAASSASSGASASALKKKIRPIKKFFDRDEVDNKGGSIEQGPYPGTVRFAGMIFEDSGHLLRRANINHLLTGEDVNADLSEIKEFKPKPDNEADEEYNSRMWMSVKKCLSMYKVGEKVEIIKGDLVAVTGKVIKVGETDLTIESDLPTQKVITVPQDHVMKKFAIGESVRALKGVNKGDTGLITHIDRDRKCASVFAFFSKQMFTCLLECLTVAPEDGLGMGGLGSINGFKLGDLVQLSTGQVGVLCFIDKNRHVRILLNEGTATNVDVSQIACKRSSFDVWAKDCNKIKIGARSNVHIIDGPNKGKSGRVLHVWRSAVFIKIPTKLEDGGYVVADARMCKVSGYDCSAMQNNNPFKVNENNDFNNPNQNNQNNRMDFNRRGRGGGRGGGWGGRPPRNKYDDEFTGKIVKVVRGKHKGLIASIRRIDANNCVHVLLQCRPQEIKVQKSDLQIFETTADYIEHYPGNKVSLFPESNKGLRSEQSFFSPPNIYDNNNSNSNNMMVGNNSDGNFTNSSFSAFKANMR